MELNYLHLVLLLVPVIILYSLLLYKMHDHLEKLYVSITFWGLYFYGGIGASSYETGASYTFYFLIFLAAFVFFYRLRYIFPNALRNSISGFYRTGGKTMYDEALSGKIIIYIYLFTCFLSLLYPEFKVGSLFHPPAPNGVEALLNSVNNSESKDLDIISKLIFYIRLLILPLYFLALAKYAKRPFIFFLLVFLPLYFDYCSSEYVGRGLILIDLGVWYISVYRFNKKIRVPLVAATVVVLPLLLILFYTYSIARLGNEFNINLDASVIGDLFYGEINFPDSFQSVVDSGQHVHFTGFITWLVTLPFPKFLFGSLLNVPVLNFELSEIVLGVNRNDPSFWVKLTGYISESYYVFGEKFFWVEALMVAWLSKTIFFLLRLIKGSEVLIIYVAIQFGFMFSRAGLGAILPAFTNGFLALYFYFALKLYISNHALKKKNAG